MHVIYAQCNNALLNKANTMQTQNVTSAVIAALANAASVNATVQYCTTVATAAAHKHLLVQKHTTASVTLHANSNAYTIAVRNDTNDNSFNAKSASFTHDSNCAAIVTSSKGNTQLYCFMQSATSYYTINNVVATKAQVAALLTNSARNALLHNVSNAAHNVIVRTINISNISSIAIASS